MIFSAEFEKDLRIKINNYFESKGFVNIELFPIILYNNDSNYIRIYKEYFTHRYSKSNLDKFPNPKLNRIIRSQYFSKQNGILFIFEEDWNTEIEWYIIEAIINELQRNININELCYFTYFNTPEDSKILSTYTFNKSKQQIIPI